MGKWASIDLTLCDPKICDQQCGICQASLACTHKILIQDDPYDEPMLISVRMCVGCGDCVTACPLRAIKILSGY